MSKGRCRINDCASISYARDLCRKHYDKEHREWKKAQNNPSHRAEHLRRGWPYMPAGKAELNRGGPAS